MKYKIRTLIFLPLLAITVVSGIVATSNNAQAAPVTGFDPGLIIDNGVFTNALSMNTQEIQAFLNSKVPSCDTWGTKTSEYGGGTRAQWAASRGYSPPFTCLRDYTENGKTAAQIIADTANQFQINPQVLLVVLQKEQGLVTDTWPLANQYSAATGYGCPDTAACNSAYYGLTNQIQWTARMYRSIMNASPNWYTPYVLGNNTIKWNPSSACGSSVVNIQNRATQALYNYTPYRPNQAALDAGYGTGDSCSSYGNRNFYLYFTDWFGSVRAVNGSIVISHALTTSSQTLSQGDTVNAWFEIVNNSSVTVNVGGMGVCARMNGVNYDFGFTHQNTIAPNAKLIFTYNKKLTDSGALELFICSYNDALGGWASNTYPYNASPVLNRTLSYTVADNPLLTSSVSTSPAIPSIGQPVTVSATLRNSGTSPINIGSLTVAGRSPSGANVDFPIVNDVIIPAGGEYTYNQTRTFNEDGDYSFYIANWNGVWSTSYPKASAANVLRSIKSYISANPALTEGLSITQFTSGANAVATFKIRNTTAAPINIGSLTVAGRSPSGANVDFPIVNDVIIPAGGEYTYSQSRVYTQPGSYTFYIANWNGVWSTSYPKSVNPTILRNVNSTLR